MPSQWLAVEAGTDLLARARQIQRSWERLLAEGALGPELPPEATAGLRPAIVDSWRRSLATGLDPTDLLPSIEADPSETRARWLEHPLGSFRHVLAEQLQLLAHESNSLVQVTDPSGLTLHLDGPEWLKARAAEMNLVEGARCAETVNGTNGVGTALAADHPVQVFAFEHFSHHHREWVCSGSPVHDPVSGRLVGVLDLSSPWKIAHPRSLELVTTAARTLEQCLLETRRDQDARLTRRYGDLATKSTDLLVNREGYVLIGDSAQPKPFDVPESGGEITMGDGSLAVAEPLGRGEAYLLRRLAPPRARAARAEALERAEGRVHEQAGEDAALRYGGGQGLAATEGSGRTSIESDQRVSAYFEAALDCVIIADASGRVVEFNPAAEQTFGYSRDEALGRTIAELIVPPSLRERHITAFARFIETGHGAMLGRRLELTGMRADGSEFPVELALSQVEAEPALICGALRDISAAQTGRGPSARARRGAGRPAAGCDPRSARVVAARALRGCRGGGRAHHQRPARAGWSATSRTARGWNSSAAGVRAWIRSRSERAGSSTAPGCSHPYGRAADLLGSTTTRTYEDKPQPSCGRRGCVRQSQAPSLSKVGSGAP